ncbi:MAG: metallophosphoesterase [Anaerovoracaceae bacterium]
MSLGFIKEKKKWKTGLVCSLALVCGAVFSAPSLTAAATEHFNDASSDSTNWTKWKESWDTVKSNYEHVSLTPGRDQTELNLGWYSQTQETPKVRIGTNKDTLESTGREISGSQAAITGVEALSGYYSNKVTVTGLKESTEYYYQVFQNGKWQDAAAYTTGSSDSFSFFYVGDPQIGASKKQTDSENTALQENDENDYAARNDAYNWNKVLKMATRAHPEASFMISAGDQVNTATNEAEYAGYLYPDALKSLPVATTIGNHDATSAQYSCHFNNPNTYDTTDSSQEAYTKGATAAGTDYYYTYGNTLFIVLDTNNYNCETHKNVIKQATEKYPKAKWRVVTFHQDIYGSGDDHSDSDGMILRTQLTPLFQEYKIDVVLQGHDHTYSRTYQLQSDGKQHKAYSRETMPKDARNDAEYQNENKCYAVKSSQASGTVTNPDGTVYLEANSGTGSKFYNLIASQQDYISERSQTWTPSYSVISVTGDTFSVTTYDGTDNSKLDKTSTYTIRKTTASRPAKVKSLALKAGRHSVRASWKKVAGASSYKVQFSRSRSFKKGVKTYTVKSTSKTLKNAKRRTRYYVRVAAVSKASGRTAYGSYSTVKNCRTK